MLRGRGRLAYYVQIVKSLEAAPFNRPLESCARLVIKAKGQPNPIVRMSFWNISEAPTSTEHEVERIQHKGLARVGGATDDVEAFREVYAGRFAGPAKEGKGIDSDRLHWNISSWLDGASTG
jgi:hypothetical protein